MEIGKRWIETAACALALALFCWPTEAQAQPRYTAQRLTPPGATSSGGMSLNEAGQVLGGARYRGATYADEIGRAFLYTPGPLGSPPPPATILLPSGWSSSWGRWHGLGEGGHAFIELWDAAGTYGQVLHWNGTYTYVPGDFATSWHGPPNSAGAMAGDLYDAGGPRAAVFQNGTVTPLGDGSFPEAAYINDAGEVVGYSPPFLYRAGSILPLPFLRTAQSSDDREGPLGSSGMVLGVYATESGQERLGYWSNGVTLDIGRALPTGHLITADPIGMNGRNDVVGNATLPQSLQLMHGYVYNFNGGTLRDLGSLGGDTCVHGINDLGEAVGHSEGPGNRNYSHNGSGMSFVYTGGRMYDLNTLVPPGTGVVFTGYDGSINNRGQILVPGVDAAGYEHAYLLTPVPATSSRLGGLRRADGWFRSNTTVTLTGTDAVNGVREIHSRVDNGAETVVRSSTLAATATATLTVSQVGTHLVTYWSVDAFGNAEPPKTTTVSIDRGSLVISTTALADAQRGSPYSAALTAIQGSAPYRWTAVTAPPCGLSLSTGGVLSGTPTCEGSYSFMVQATGVNLATARSYLTLRIYAPLEVAIPAQTSTTVQAAAFPLLASGGQPPYRWSIDPATPLPQNMAIDQASILSSGNTLGASIPLNLTVTDARGVAATKSVQISVLEDLYMTGPVDATNVTVGQAFSIQLTATGGRPPYTWSIYGYSWPPFPPGATVDPLTGVVTGTAAAEGGYYFVAEIVDADGNIGGGSHGIGVYPPQ